MIGMDSNVFLRFITEDDPKQTKEARKVFESYEDNPRSIYISDIVLCEVIWTLKFRYKYDKSEIIAVLEVLSDMEEILFDNLQLLKQTIGLYREGSADFPDYFIVLKNKQAGCEYTYSFDKKLIKESLALSIPN